jgi:hypothetical protein
MFLLFSTLPQIYLWHSPDATHSFENNFRISLASAYVALGLLALTLSLGVWRLLKNGKPAPVHFDLRRDVGEYGLEFSRFCIALLDCSCI